MQSRGISLNEQELAKLDDTVEKLSKKGARESLIYLNDIALVVSIKNRTVITAMEGANGNDNIRFGSNQRTSIGTDNTKKHQKCTFEGV